MLENELAELVRAEEPISFDTAIPIDENVTVKPTVTIDEDAVHFKTKNDAIRIDRKDIVAVGLSGVHVTMVAQSIPYNKWSAKRKFEKKYPGQAFNDYQPEVVAWTMVINEKKSAPLTAATIAERLRRLKAKAYVAGLSETDPDRLESLHIGRCPRCETLMDVTDYADSDNVFCNVCAKPAQRQFAGELENQGICNACGYYTKLTSPTNPVCHGCNFWRTMKTFLGSLGFAVLIIAVNVGTIMIANRFFPVLLVVAAGTLLVNLFLVFKLFTLSAARAAGVKSPIERAATFLRKGQTDEAFSVFQSAGDDMMQHPGVLLNLTRGLSNEKKWDRAADLCETLNQEYPNFELGLVERVNVAIGNGETPEEVRQRGERLQETMQRNQLVASERPVPTDGSA